MSNEPLVSIGLPTYNRPTTLVRAIESALNQDYQEIELLISDNASTDETEAICRELAGRDKRVKYFRQPTNQGPVANFREALKYASGQFFIFLADDDWLDRSYISRCLQVLLEHPEYSLVCGKARYFQHGTFAHEGLAINLLQDRASDRVLSYYQQVSENGTFYGLTRRAQISELQLRNKMGGDWLWIAAIAFMGKIKTLDDVHLNRGLGGATVSFEKIAASLGLSSFSANHPNLSIAASSFSDIVWRSTVYTTDGILKRLWLSCKVFAVVVDRGPQLFERNVYSKYLPRPLAISVLMKVLPASMLDSIRARRRQRRARANDHRI